MQDNYLSAYAAACAELRGVGVRNVHAYMVLFAMLCTGDSYGEAVREYAEFRGDTPERIHGLLCYVLLRAGKDISPERLLSELKGRVKFENGVFIATGS